MAGESEIKIERGFSYPLPTLDLYESSLINRLEILQEPKGEDRKDLSRWLSATSFMEKGDKAPTKGMLHYNNGRGLITLSSEKPLPGVITPETKPADILEVQARIAAKLAFIGELDNIPLEVRDEARKVEKKVNKEAKQILDSLPKQREVHVGDKTPRISKRQFLDLGVAGASAFFLAACGVKMEGSPTRSFNPASPTSVPSETYTPTTATTAKATETNTQTPTPEVNYAEINIFNESTWPEKYKSFWDGGWLNSKEADRQDFQQFIEKVRTAFFAKEGMTDEVAKMTEIRPELRSLWGMIYWAETHKDDVIKNQSFISVTPTELEWMMTDPTSIGFTWAGEEVRAWKGKMINQGTQYVVYKVANSHDMKNFSSDALGVPIAGKDGLVHIPRGPYFEIFGDLAALGYIGEGESRVNLLLMSVLDKDGFHHLVAPAVPLGKDMVIPKGSPCPTSDGSGLIITLSKDLKIGQLQNLPGKIYTAEELFKLLGKNIDIGFTANPPINNAAYCLEPKSKDDIATYLYAVYSAGDQDNWPWTPQ